MIMDRAAWREDTAERLGKTWVQTFLSFVMSTAIGHIAHLTIWEQGIIFASCAAALSLATSIISRWYGQPGTASLIRRVFYE